MVDSVAFYIHLLAPGLNSQHKVLSEFLRSLPRTLSLSLVRSHVRDFKIPHAIKLAVKTPEKLLLISTIYTTVPTTKLLV